MGGVISAEASKTMPNIWHAKEAICDKDAMIDCMCVCMYIYIYIYIYI